MGECGRDVHWERIWDNSWTKQEMFQGYIIRANSLPSAQWLHCKTYLVRCKGRRWLVHSGIQKLGNSALNKRGVCLVKVWPIKSSQLMEIGGSYMNWLLHKWFHLRWVYTKGRAFFPWWLHIKQKQSLQIDQGMHRSHLAGYDYISIVSCLNMSLASLNSFLTGLESFGGLP